MIMLFGFIIRLFLIGIISLSIPQENLGLKGYNSSAQRFLNILTAFGILIYFLIAITLNLLIAIC